MRSLSLLLTFAASTTPFVPAVKPVFVRPMSILNDGESNIETIEFRIFPDGRVEEVVRGVRGVNCNKVTEEINAVLGKVVASEPTEELFLQDMTLDNVVQVSDGNWEGSSTW